jgi:hypothetical protein
MALGEDSVDVEMDESGGLVVVESVVGTAVEEVVARAVEGATLLEVGGIVTTVVVEDDVDGGVVTLELVTSDPDDRSSEHDEITNSAASSGPTILSVTWLVLL